MTQPRRIPWFAIIAAVVCLLAVPAALRAQNVVDDGHEVVITSFPDGASVLIDGVDTGKVTPMELRRIAPGIHTITVSANSPGWQTDTRTITVLDVDPVKGRFRDTHLSFTLMPILATGPAGPQGPPGPQGPAGPAGGIGVPGATGATGPAGPQGPAGPAGATGAAGTNGSGFNFRQAFDPAAVYAVNDVVTFNGSTYAAVIANGPGNVTPDISQCQLGGPGSGVGPCWIVWAQAGTPGAAGPQGSMGPIGLTGAPGAQGPQGPQGAQGATGATGATGPAGLDGATGATGAAGPQGPPGINNKGAWSSATAYNQSDAVFDMGSFWLASAPSTNSEPSPTNTNWQILAAGINNRGPWQNTAAYNANDAVTDGGSFWLALASNTNSEPSSSNFLWLQLAAQGAAGPAGQPGAPGAPGAAGATGPQGQTGPAGPAGPQGPQGLPGSNSLPGQNTASGDLALSNNTTGTGNSAYGYQALFGNTTGFGNTASGYQALQTNATGFNNTAIGAGADVSAGDITNATAIGAGAIVDASNRIRLGNSSVTIIEAQVGLTVVSDRHQKENIQPVDGEEVLKKIRGISLSSWNLIGQDAKQFRHYGPMAQDFFAAFGKDGIGTIGSPTTITSTDLDGIVMAAVKGLEERTTEQSKQLDALKAENAGLKEQLKALERKLGVVVAAPSQPAP